MFEDFFTAYSNIPISKKLTETSVELPSETNGLVMPGLNTVQQYPQPEQDLFSFWTEISNYTPEQQQQSPTQELRGSKGFEEAFQKALEINPNIAKYKNFLVKTAKRESGFNHAIQNSAGAPYYGYFQMGKDEIAVTTKKTVEQFRNDPVAQILGACKLYEMNLNSIKKLGIYSIGRERGYSDDALVSGAWMGGPGGVKKYLLGQGDPSDSHWYKNGKGGSSVGKIMNNWKENEKD